MQKITPFLWFNDQAEAAAAFYVSLFPDSRILTTTRYTQDSGADRAGTVMTVLFELAGQRFIALNGGPQFPFTEAVSFQIDCETQAEVDRLWDALTEGGQEVQCGWLKDRFGLSWQVVPRRLFERLSDPDPARAQRATQAMLGMKKLDVAALERAAAGGQANAA